MRRGQVDVATRLAADDDERGLAAQLGRTYVGDPDLTWPEGWLGRHAEDPLAPLVLDLLVSHTGLDGRAGEVGPISDPDAQAELAVMATLPPFRPPSLDAPVTLPMKLDQLTALPMVQVEVGGRLR